MTNWPSGQKKNLLSSLLTDATIENFEALGHRSPFAGEVPVAARATDAPAAGAPTLAPAAIGDQRGGASKVSDTLLTERETTARARRGRGRDDRGRGGRRDDRRGSNDASEELIEKLVHINRVSKTVKGGKRFGFAALVVVGDGKGRVGFGHGKAREVPEAISKATASAKKAIMRVALKDGRTLHHDANGHFGAGKVTVRSAPQGTGIIAGGPMRAVFESLGVADVVTKSHGTNNPYNMIRATFDALANQATPRAVAARRGKRIRDILAPTTSYVEQEA